MLITRVSPLTGKSNMMDLDITIEQIEEYTRPGRTKLIQDIFPNLSVSEREFIKTGYTQEDWDVLFADQDE